MNNYWILMASMIFAITHISEAKPLQHNRLTPDQKAEMRQRMLTKTGGLMVVPGKGKLMIINCQKDYEYENVVSNLPLFRKVLRINIRSDQGSFSIFNAVDGLKKHDASALVYLIDDKKLPMSMVAPEEMWGFVNTAKLRADSPDLQRYHNRIKKALSRTITYVLGGVSSRSKSSVMQTISNVNQLDLIENEIPSSDVLINLYQNISKIGITQNKLTTYLKACQEGWAPAPTNGYQKAIWDKVRSDKERGPTNPIEIPMPKKK